MRETNFYYDPAVQAFDGSLWKAISGVPSIVSSKLSFNADEAIQYAECVRGVYKFGVVVPTTPIDGYLTGGTGITTQIYGLLTGGASATSVIGTWTAVTDGGFKATIDGTLKAVGPINFTGVADMNAVAAKIQTAVRAATGGTETVVWSTNKFIITASKSCSVLTSPDSGTDISGVGATAFMDSETGRGTATTGWRNVANGEFTVTVDNVAYNITGINFITATDLDGVAALIQAKLRSIITGNTWITCVYSTDPAGHFVITSREGVSLLTAVSGGSGTDISGIAAGNQYLDGDAAGTSVSVTSGTQKQFGLKSISRGTQAIFKFSGSVLFCITTDEKGVTTTTQCIYDTNWSGVVVDFTINWAGQCVTFGADGVVLACQETSIPRSPMSIYVNNADSDSLAFSYFEGLGIESYI